MKFDARGKCKILLPEGGVDKYQIYLSALELLCMPGLEKVLVQL